MKQGGRINTRSNSGSSSPPAGSGDPARMPSIVGLQRVHGNRFVTNAVQRKCACGGTCPKCKNKALQRKGAGAPGALSPSMSTYLSNPGGGRQLNPSSASIPGDFSDVRVHDDSNAHAATSALNAQAMTVGNQIFFSRGSYQPESASGRELLSHELTHVLQQRGGAVSGEGIVENGALEREADDVAAGRTRDVHSVGRQGIQRKPQVDEEDEKKSAPAPNAKDKDAGKSVQLPEPPRELRSLDLLPPSLRPRLYPPEESDQDRVNRMLREIMQEEDRKKGLGHLSNSPGPTAQPGVPATQPKKIEEADLISSAKALLARCNRDQVVKGDPARKQPDEPADATRPVETDNGKKISEAVEACLDTPEGEAFTEKAKQFFLSQRGAPITVGAVGALLTNFAITGKLVYIPSIPLGKDAELSIDIDGPVDHPDQAMLTLKVKDVEGFGSWLWSGLKTVGRGIATFASWIGRGIATFAGWIWTGVSWLASQIFDKIVGVLGRLVGWMLKLPFRVARLVKTLIEGVAAVRPWSGKFWASLIQASTWVDFLKWLGTVALELAEIAGLGEIYETIMDLLKFNTRSLEGAETETAKKVFGSTIPWHLVRLDDAALIGPSWTKREYTAFHTISGWGHTSIDTLIHELTHVWQYEATGAIYMPRAIHAQATVGYNYGGVPGLKAAGSLDSFNQEQQALIVQDFFRIAQGKTPVMSAGSRADQALYASFVKRVSSHDETYLANLRV